MAVLALFTLCQRDGGFGLLQQSLRSCNIKLAAAPGGNPGCANEQNGNQVTASAVPGLAHVPKPARPAHP